MEELRTFVLSLSKELSVAPPVLPQRREEAIVFTLRTDLLVKLFDIQPGIVMQGELATMPVHGQESLVLLLMRANLLGQGTGGGVLGLAPNLETVLLTSHFPYDMSYREFHAHFEDFANYMVYWREEIHAQNVASH